VRSKAIGSKGDDLSEKATYVPFLLSSGYFTGALEFIWSDQYFRRFDYTL